MPTGLKVSQYDLQRENGVLNMLEGRIHFTTGVFPGSSIKKDIMLDVYIRKTIPWSAHCEI
jgi:hypothetical protein